MEQKPKRGFAAMTTEAHRQIASRGGKSAHAQGRAHQFTPDEASAAGTKGGTANARKHGSAYMAAIGRKGGRVGGGDHTK